MKIINNTCIIGVDSGFGNMKTANTIFRTGFTPIDDELLFGGDVLEYDGHRYLIGAEHKAMQMKRRHMPSWLHCRSRRTCRRARSWWRR